MDQLCRAGTKYHWLKYPRYAEGRIEQKTRPPRARLAFSPRSLSELADVTIESEEGEEIFAHKCMLAAR
jgi:hypothetical protein